MLFVRSLRSGRSLRSEIVGRDSSQFSFSQSGRVGVCQQSFILSFLQTFANLFPLSLPGGSTIFDRGLSYLNPSILS